MSQVKDLVDAIDAFIKGTKADGTWGAIKASCIMAGWNNLNGALTPLVGTAPTNFNFVGSDYNRKTGLAGDATSKTLNTNRADNAQPQDDFHGAIYITDYVPGGDGLSSGSTVGNSLIALSSTRRRLLTRSRTANNFTIDTATDFLGIIGHSRGSGASYDVRVAQQNFSQNMASQTPTSATQFVFSRSGVGNFSASRIAFYSIGENINLVQLDNRVSTLMTAINGAIP